MTTTYFTHAPEETECLGKKLASFLSHHKKQAFIAMFGEMGVGKTAFVRGFCSALDIHTVHSPTYAIVNEYLDGKVPVFHFDMYRIASEDDLESIAFWDYLVKDGFALCEWSENIKDALPENAILVSFERTNSLDAQEENHRKITIKGEFHEDFSL